MDNTVQKMLNAEMNIEWKPSPFYDKSLEEKLRMATERYRMTAEELREASSYEDEG